jgi:hypothetical protein
MPGPLSRKTVCGFAALLLAFAGCTSKETRALLQPPQALGTVPGVATDRLLLANLLEARTSQLAIVDGADPAAPTAAKADANHELFAQNYRILRSPD